MSSSEGAPGSEGTAEERRPGSFRVASQPTVRITVYDAARSVCGRGEGSVRLNLPAGLYVVLFERGGKVHKEIVDHKDATDLAHPGPPPGSPIPNEDYAEPARRFSVEDTGPPLSAAPHESRLFIFLRRARPDAGPEKIPSEPVSIHDVDGRPLATLSSDARIDDNAGYAAFSCKVAPGTYRIRSGSPRRDVAITVPAARAAHVFIGDAGTIRLDEMRVSLVPLGAVFDPASPIVHAMESVVAALRVPDRQLSDTAHALLLDAAEKDLCFGIAAVHLLRRPLQRHARLSSPTILRGDPTHLLEIFQRERTYAVMAAAVMQRLVKYREIPDISILEQLTDPTTLATPRSPPLFRASLLAATTGFERAARKIPARCALAQAARTGLLDSIWCTWRARTWDERWIEPTVEQLRSQDRGSDTASIARRLALPASTVGEALRALDAGTPSGKERPLESTELVVPGYALGAVLGRGPQSTVFHATRQRDERAVAVKIVALAGGADACARVLRELSRSEPVDDRCILAPAAWGALPGDGGIWLELELCRGSVLDLVAEADAPMRVSDACWNVLDALEGLAHLHRRGIVHGGLKPENLLIRDDGSIAIADLALTRCLASEMPASGAARAPRFTPPELLAGDAMAAVPASDVWAMAATLHFLLTLEPPRDEYADQSQLEAAKANPIVPLAARRPDVPPELASCIDRALSPEIGARPADAGAFRDELRPFGPGGASTPTSRWPLALGLALLGFGVVISFFAATLIGDPDPVPADAPLAIDASLAVDTPLLADVPPPIDAPPIDAPPIDAPPIDAPPIDAPPIDAPPIDARPIVIIRPFETITLEVISTPPGANVWLQEHLKAGPRRTQLGVTPLRKKVRQSKRKAYIIVAMPRYEDARNPVDLTRNERVEVTLEIPR